MNDKISSEKGFLIDGGAGEMGTWYQQILNVTHPRSDVNPIDAQNIPKEYLANAFNSTFAALSKNCGNAVGVLAVPLEVFGTGENVKSVLGLNTRGQNADCLVNLTSVQHDPLKVLESFPGMSLGVHNMHKPPELIMPEEGLSIPERNDEIIRQMREKLSKSQVIVMATDMKKEHNLYGDTKGDTFKHYERYFLNLFEEIGYQDHNIITDLTPEGHDKLMSNVQFLTHSMYLVSGLFLESEGKNSISKETEEVTFALSEIVKRMMGLHYKTYYGIASGNPFNEELLQDWISEVSMISADSREALLSKLVLVTNEVGKSFLEGFVVGQTAKKIKTPVSAVRTGLPQTHDSFGASGDLNLRNILKVYQQNMLVSDVNYKKKFDQLSDHFPTQGNISNDIIAQYQ